MAIFDSSQKNSVSPLASAISVATGSVNYFIEATVIRWALGVFGSGVSRTYVASGYFTVPNGVTQVRVILEGGGGGGGAMLMSGATPSPGAPGGTSSFGAYCSATGGAGGTGAPGAGTAAGGEGGTGVGGDLNYKGGRGGSQPANAKTGGGGGGCATPLGDGGPGADCGLDQEGVKAVGSMYSTGGASGNCVSYNLAAAYTTAGPAQIPIIINRALMLDYLTAARPTGPARRDGRPGPCPLVGGDGGGGDASYPGAGGGGGGLLGGGLSGNGVDNTAPLQYRGGEGGPGGGGGGGAGGASGGGHRGTGGGGGGCAVKVIDVTPGQVIALTVGLGGAGGVGSQTNGGRGGDGSITVEF